MGRWLAWKIKPPSDVTTGSKRSLSREDRAQAWRCRFPPELQSLPGWEAGGLSVPALVREALGESEGGQGGGEGKSDSEPAHFYAVSSVPGTLAAFLHFIPTPHRKCSLVCPVMEVVTTEHAFCWVRGIWRSKSMNPCLHEQTVWNIRRSERKG